MRKKLGCSFVVAVAMYVASFVSENMTKLLRCCGFYELGAQDGDMSVHVRKRIVCVERKTLREHCPLLFIGKQYFMALREKAACSFRDFFWGGLRMYRQGGEE